MKNVFFVFLCFINILTNAQQHIFIEELDKNPTCPYDLNKTLLENINSSWNQFDIQGDLILYLKIDTNGNINNVNIIKGLQESFDRNIRHIFYRLPMWNAAEFKGKKVESIVFIFIQFQSDSNDLKCNVKIENIGEKATYNYNLEEVFINNLNPNIFKVGFEGTFQFYFSIDTLGRICNVNILKGFTEGLNDIILKAVNELPNWESAKLNEKKVESIIYITYKHFLE